MKVLGAARTESTPGVAFQVEGLSKTLCACACAFQPRRSKTSSTKQLSVKLTWPDYHSGQNAHGAQFKRGA